MNKNVPDKAGVWEWFEEDGTKRLVSVYDVGVPGHPHLRVAWWGGYYTVNDRIEDIFGHVGGKWVVVKKDVHYEAEWSDRWGNYVGTNDSVSEEQLYQIPTPEQRERILAKYTARLKG